MTHRKFIAKLLLGTFLVSGLFAQMGNISKIYAVDPPKKAPTGNAQTPPPAKTTESKNTAYVVMPPSKKPRHAQKESPASAVGTASGSQTDSKGEEKIIFPPRSSSKSSNKSDESAARSQSLSNAAIIQKVKEILYHNAAEHPLTPEEKETVVLFIKRGLYERNKFKLPNSYKFEGLLEAAIRSKHYDIVEIFLDEMNPLALEPSVDIKYLLNNPELSRLLLKESIKLAARGNCSILEKLIRKELPCVFDYSLISSLNFTSPCATPEQISQRRILLDLIKYYSRFSNKILEEAARVNDTQTIRQIIENSLINTTAWGEYHTQEYVYHDILSTAIECNSCDVISYVLDELAKDNCVTTICRYADEFFSGDHTSDKKFTFLSKTVELAIKYDNSALISEMMDRASDEELSDLYYVINGNKKFLCSPLQVAILYDKRNAAYAIIEYLEIRFKNSLRAFGKFTPRETYNFIVKNFNLDAFYRYKMYIGYCAEKDSWTVRTSQDPDLICYSPYDAISPVLPMAYRPPFI